MIELGGVKRPRFFDHLAWVNVCGQNGQKNFDHDHRENINVWSWSKIFWPWPWPKFKNFGKSLGAARQIFLKFYEFVLKIALFWRFCRDLTMLMVMVRNFWPWPWGKSQRMHGHGQTIFDHDHSENLNVWWSWSKLYPPLNKDWVQKSKWYHKVKV